MNNVVPMTETQVGTNPTEKIVVCIEGQDRFWDYETFDLTYDHSDSDILNRLVSPIQETFGVDIRDGYSGWLYKIRRAVDSRNVFLIPNSTAGY